MDKSEFNILLQRLDQFIRRYYLNQIIRGMMLTLAIGLSYFVVVSILEYIGNFNSDVRTFMFYSLLFIILGVSVWFFIRPLLGYLRIGKLISHKQAAHILRNYFPDMQDKLENTLELADMSRKNPQATELIHAAIEQKTEDIKPIPFLSALPLKASLKYAIYIVPPVLIIVLVLSFWPAAISEGTERIVKHRQDFIPPPPFEFQLETADLAVRKGADLTLKLSTTGDNIPGKVWVHFSGNRLLMEQNEPNQFVYQFKNINNSIEIYFKSGEVQSRKYRIEVLPSPTLVNYQISLTPPAYTGEKPSKINNQGDINIPAGTAISWSFNTRETNVVSLLFSDSTLLMARESGQFYHADTMLSRSVNYQILLANENFASENPIQYRIHVVPDLFPEIQIQEMRDSTDMNIFYFNGMIRDDYGFKSLRFYYQSADVKNSESQFINVPFNANQSPQEFYFAFDFSQFESDEISAIRYYFEVGDNDAIQGSKKTKSNAREFRFPSKEELNQMNDQTNSELEDKINEAKDLSRKLRKNMEDLQRKLIDKNMSQWERQQTMQQIMEKQNALEDLTQQIAKQNQQRNEFMDSYGDRREDIMEKQKQVEEMMENLMDDELKKMIEELNELMKQNKTDDMQELMKDMEFSYDDLEKQLDNNLEMLKRMEVEERLQNQIDQLKELSEKHEKLSEETENKDKPTDELKEKQAEHQKALDDIQEEYEKTMEKNEKLSDPMDMQDFKESFEEIQQEMQKGQENLEKGKKNKASENQKNSSQKMQELSESMQSMMDQNMQESAQENMDDMRQLLENLMRFSFDQEELLTDFNVINSRDPRFREIVNQQTKIEEHFQMIDDSLTALGARVPMVGGLIRKEQKSIRNQLGNVLDDINDNRIHKVRTGQQLVMTHTNNLALLLSEALDQMQQQMNSMSNSDGQCQKPGQGKPKMGEMRKRQQSMKQQLQQMLEMMKNGKKPGGQQGQQQQMSKQIAKMLAEQEIMQQMLNEMMSNQTISPDAAKMLREINRMMEENKNDLINRNITPNMLKRQEQIVTRMLEAEQSEFEREIDKKRKSQEAREYKVSNPEKAFEKTKKQARFNELLEFSNLKMHRYYKEKYQEYLIKISE
ncbi:MAG: DUF4175 family protein [Bacteroidota bacterium]|nr:DUF4175 family protein [Bacteroidota bacterium]